MSRDTSSRPPSRSTSPSAIWGGRFDTGPADAMVEINTSVDVDCRMLPQDIAASKAHCNMLVRQGVIAESDGQAIIAGLDRIGEEAADGHFTMSRSLEDVHMNVEARLGEIIGEPAGRLHTARSRNDQVATDFRLWIRDAIDGLDAALKTFQAVLLDKADAHADWIMPGFTHLQSAQPVTLGHHLLAYVEMVARDRDRLADCRRRLSQCPLGAAALAGTSFPVDRWQTAAALGFLEPAANSLDAVSDRDFALEFLAAGAILAVHLSRLGEEIVIWCSHPFRFLALSDAFSTGSSIMPQKRNPDGAELVRAKAGRVIGDLVGLLTVIKGLPLAYAKDLQEDKEPVFDAADALRLSVAALTGMISTGSFDRLRMESQAAAGHPTATDLADWLVRVKKLPFRRAHHIAGAAVKAADARGCALDALPLAAYREIDAAIDEDVYSVLGIAESVASRTSYGGTAPERVREAIAAARLRYLI
jgi:argininosuccinate lyase